LKRFEMILGCRGHNVLRINGLLEIAYIRPFTEPFQNVSNHFKIATDVIPQADIQFAADVLRTAAAVNTMVKSSTC
jgi:hypothetical protein